MQLLEYLKYNRARVRKGAQKGCCLNIYLFKTYLLIQKKNNIYMYVCNMTNQSSLWSSGTGNDVGLFVLSGVCLFIV